MNPILFEKTATTFTSRGICALPDCIECKVTEERNGEFELAMVYPITGEFFDEIQEDRIIVAVPYEGGSKQAFRIYRREAELDGQITFYARHISYQLNFIPVGIVSGNTDSAQTMMQAIAAAAEITCPFTFWSDIVKGGAYDWSTGVPCGIRSALGGQEGSVLDVFGGEFEWDNFTVKLHGARGADNGVSITYGRNMTDLSDALDIGDTVTGVMAFAQYDNEGVTTTVYSSPRIITVATNPYAHQRIIPLDCSDQFEDTIPTALDVTSYAEAWLRRTTQVDPATEVTLSFVQLSNTEEYRDAGILDSVHLCDTVHVRYPALGLTVTKKVTKCVWDVLANRYDEISLGSETTLVDTIVDLQGGNNVSGGGSASASDLLAVYPVGSIYMSVSSVSPEVLFGGQWQRITGKFLLAATDGGSSGASQAAGNEGGAASNTLTENNLPQISGSFDVRNAGTSAMVSTAAGKVSIGNGGSASPTAAPSGSANTMRKVSFSFGKSSPDAITNLPPFLSVYVWKRTA